MKNHLLIFTILFLLVFPKIQNAQTSSIIWLNPSFEGEPRPASTPLGWLSCSQLEFPQETPPDIHPFEGIGFGVKQLPSHGNTYLGMVVRENQSWEFVAQNLESELVGGQCYSFTIDLCTSNSYISYLRGENRQQKISFNTPILLNIWGGNKKCERKELLAVSPVIYNHDWMTYRLEFSPTENYGLITLEAFPESTTPNFPNGNILLDNLTDIRVFDCGSGESMIRPEQPQNEFKPQPIEEIIKSRKEVEKELAHFASFIKFKKNKLTPKAKFYVKKIVKSMNGLSNHQLIIDFGGLKEKYFGIRKLQIEIMLRERGLLSNEFEILNSREEDKSVKWLYEGDHFYVGLKKDKD